MKIELEIPDVVMFNNERYVPRSSELVEPKANEVFYSPYSGRLFRAMWDMDLRFPVYVKG
jgi:hypothetical protein